MIGLAALAPYRLAIGACGALAVAGSIYVAGHRSGAAGVQARWDAAEIARIEAEDARRALDEARGAAAARTYEAATAAIKARHAKHDSTLRSALDRPPASDPAASAPPALGDVRIPAAAIRELRDAAARGGLPPEPAADDLGRALRGGAGVPGPAG